jgi:hypothetical protein
MTWDAGGMPVDQPNFLTVCSLAFLTVFLLLGALALAMRAITLLLPVRVDDDAAIVAAIATSVAVISPGARVVQSEEIPCSPSPRLAKSG